MTEVLFYFFAAISIFSAAFILITKNVLHAAFALAATLLSVAALYVLAKAEFLAVTQVMIYVGGIIVLIIFGVMLTNKVGSKALVVKSHNRFFGLAIMLSVATLLITAILRINFRLLDTIPGGGHVTTTSKLGLGIMTDYVFPFELMAILLLIVLIGATTIGGYVKPKKKSDL